MHYFIKVPIKLVMPVKTIWTPMVATIRPVIRVNAFMRLNFENNLPIFFAKSINKRLADNAITIVMIVMGFP